MKPCAVRKLCTIIGPLVANVQQRKAVVREINLHSAGRRFQHLCSPFALRTSVSPVFIKDTTMTHISPLINTVEAAQILRLTPYTLRLYRMHGKGPNYKKIGSRVFYSHSDIQAYLDRATRTCTAQTESPGAV